MLLVVKIFLSTNLGPNSQGSCELFDNRQTNRTKVDYACGNTSQHLGMKVYTPT